MSTHKAIDRICVVAVVLSLLLALLFMNGEALGLQSTGKVMGYENRLFDTSRVHTIDIVMEDWDGFLETCQSEEYSPCNVVIDGESYKNVGIRGKGNTSLSSVAQMGSSRYSVKIEFDQYDSTKSYHGLDKLSLNNLIQDNTMMKDYLTYQMMNAFGVPSSLCSFAYLTVNGEDWGLYLAVEGLEDAFLQRNYGSDHGDLYKPDSLSFGGGRGNGRDFDMNDFKTRDDRENGDPSGQVGTPGFGGFSPPAMPDSGGSPPGDMGGGFSPGQEGMQPPSGSLPEGTASGRFGGMGGFSFGGSSDVKLQYIDDDPDSYANIFDSAKTKVSDQDRARLIASLKSLSAYEDLENVLDMEAVLRYFIVHNFVVNGDSYTGNMIHNYYLYEEEGRLSMIPWDYNLAFGTFAGGAASASVNEPIDDQLTDRPMQGWIFSDESYTLRYHTLYAEFLDRVDPAQMIEEAYGLIAGYVEKDPTKFCTYGEFEAGVQTLRTFCALRQESVRGQLEGRVPSTDEGQKADPAALVGTDDLDLSAMGTMNTGGGQGGFGGRGQSAGTRQPGQGTAESTAPPMDETGSASLGQEEQAPGGAFPSGGRFGNAGFSPPDGGGEVAPADDAAASDARQRAALLLGASVLALVAGLLIAFKYKR